MTYTCCDIDLGQTLSALGLFRKTNRSSSESCVVTINDDLIIPDDDGPTQASTGRLTFAQDDHSENNNCIIDGHISSDSEEELKTLLNNIWPFLDPSELRRLVIACQAWEYDGLFENDLPLRVYWEHINDLIKTEPRRKITRGLNWHPDELFKHLPSCDAMKVRGFYYAFDPESSTAPSQSSGVCFGDFAFWKGTTCGTYGGRGKKGHVTGLHVYKLLWYPPYGTSATVGVVAGSTKLQSNKYVNIIGDTPNTWGFQLRHATTPAVGNQQHSFVLPVGNPYDVFWLIIDRDQNSLQLTAEPTGETKSISDLPPSIPLYPAVCPVYGHTRVIMIYLGRDNAC